MPKARRVLLLGMGFVGVKVAQQLTSRGVAVIGTTTTPEKVPRLAGLCERVEVLRGHEAARIAQLAQACDAIINTVGPNVRRARTPEERADEYRNALAVTAASAAAAHPRCIFMSSLSVYGDGGPGHAPITESTPPAQSPEPSVVNYLAAERSTLASGHGCVLRVPDVYGGERDINYAQRVELGHTLMGGRVPFGPDALLYRVHCEDAARAVVHALEHGLTGIYNVVLPGAPPPTNRAVFDPLADGLGLPRLQWLAHIRLPARPISAEAFARTGFNFSHTDYHYE